MYIIYNREIVMNLVNMNVMQIKIKISFIAFTLLGSYCFDIPKNHGNNDTRTVIQEPIRIVTEDSKFHIPNDKWTTEAIKDIAYYLRNHKFNEWDHRYYEEQPNKKLIGFFGAFPTPQLRSLHWEVKANCHYDFFKCNNYLHSIVNIAPYSRTEDTVSINEKTLDEMTVKRLDYECKERHIYGNKYGLPFDDPAEKFQWTTTASYYMCWYTMLGIPALSMIGERCDNFANCLDSNFNSHNDDPRANDNLSFKCAMYSFCPDPCCPIKHIKSLDECRDSEKNPCIIENLEEDTSQRACQVDRKLNQNFKDVVSNRWNISCNCRKGFKWTSKFGICVDINECLLGIDECDVFSQNCLNLPGTFICVCKWGFKINTDVTLCLRFNATFLRN